MKNYLPEQDNQTPQDLLQESEYLEYYESSEPEFDSPEEEAFYRFENEFSQKNGEEKIKAIISAMEMQNKAILEFCRSIINIPDEESGKSLLTIAASNQNLKAIKTLVELGANIDGQCSEEESLDTPLYEAAFHDNIEILEFLIQEGADVNGNFSTDDVSESSGQTALHVAAATGNIHSVNLLIKHGANINATTDYEQTALYFAALNGKIDVVKILLNNGADVNIYTSSGANHETPLHAAIMDENLETIQLLLDNGAKLTITADENSPLSLAIKTQDEEIIDLIKEVIKNENENEFSSNEIFNILDLSNIYGMDLEVDTIQLLLDKGAELTITYNLLTKAIATENAEIVELIEAAMNNKGDNEFLVPTVSYNSIKALNKFKKSLPKEEKIIPNSECSPEKLSNIQDIFASNSMDFTDTESATENKLKRKATEIPSDTPSNKAQRTDSGDETDDTESDNSSESEEETSTSSSGSNYELAGSIPTGKENFITLTLTSIKETALDLFTKLAYISEELVKTEKQIYEETVREMTENREDLSSHLNPHSIGEQFEFYGNSSDTYDYIPTTIIAGALTAPIKMGIPEGLAPPLEFAMM